jgi:hypothetical protein
MVTGGSVCRDACWQHLPWEGERPTGPDEDDETAQPSPLVERDHTTKKVFVFLTPTSAMLSKANDPLVRTKMMKLAPRLLFGPLATATNTVNDSG